jgi:hypothetical protein
MQTATKKPVNGGSRPWVKCEPRVPWQVVEHMKRVPDIEDQDEPDSYTAKKHRWDLVHEP